MEVDFHGIKVDIPDEATAKRLIEERDRRTGEFNELKRSVEQLQQQSAATAAEKAEIERKAKAEADRAAALEKAKQGDIESALKQREEQLSAQFAEREMALAGALKAQSMRALLGSRKDIATESIQDMQALLASHMELVDGQLVPVVDGKPLADAAKDTTKTEAWLSQWLDARPYFRRGTVPAGGGGEGDGGGSGGGTITRSQVAKMTAEQCAQVSAGTLKVVDD